jgi:hypothetical protein
MDGVLTGRFVFILLLFGVLFLHGVCHMGCEDCLVGRMMLERHLVGGTELRIQLVAPGPN